MDIKHLPLEYPATYTAIRHHVIEAMLPGLEAEAGSAWPDLPPLAPLKGGAGAPDPKLAKTHRTAALTDLLSKRKHHLLDHAFKVLQPQQARMERGGGPGLEKRHGDADDSPWDLVLWLLEGLLIRDFADKRVTPEQRGGAPFYLYRLAQQMATSNEWRRNNAAVALTDVLYELSAEHSLERLRAYYGQVDEGYSVNHITRALRPVDRHQNAALKVLRNWQSLREPAALMVGEPPHQQEFRIRAVLRRWCIPAPWLMNWTEHLQTIRTAIGALRSRPDGMPLADGFDEEALGHSLATNKDLYLSTIEKTEAKLQRVLQQLCDLKELSGSAAQPLDLEELLDHLEQATSDSDGGADQAEAPLDRVFGALDHVRHPLVRVGVQLRLIRRVPAKQDRQALNNAFVDLWMQPIFDSRSLFDLLRVTPGIPSLTDAALARAMGATPAGFRALVDDAIATLDNAANHSTGTATDVD